jgi:hypothetical protein
VHEQSARGGEGGRSGEGRMNMRRFRIPTIVVLLMIAIAPSAQPMTKSDQEHTAWIDRVMREIATIKPGMTRADALKVFQEEGGLSTVKHRTYVFKDCPYIKVTFEFDPVEKPDAEGRFLKESPRDRIVKMSRPYLEWSIMD